jgi:hypothetical protein
VGASNEPPIQISRRAASEASNEASIASRLIPEETMSFDTVFGRPSFIVAICSAICARSEIEDTGTRVAIDSVPEPGSIWKFSKAHEAGE